MNPLEHAAREFYRNAYLGDEKSGWLAFSPMAKKHAMNSMRAALLALAECEIPDRAALDGLSASGAGLDSIRSIFKAMLRSIATGEDQ